MDYEHSGFVQADREQPAGSNKGTIDFLKFSCYNGR